MNLALYYWIVEDGRRCKVGVLRCRHLSLSLTLVIGPLTRNDIWVFIVNRRHRAARQGPRTQGSRVAVPCPDPLNIVARIEM